MIVKVEFDKDEELLKQLDNLCKTSYRSRPMCIKFILSEYFKGLDIQEPIVAKETITMEVVEPKVEVSVSEVEMEEDIPLDALNF